MLWQGTIIAICTCPIYKRTHLCFHLEIFLQGYKQRKGFIISQSPMVTTARDFIKMLYERECGVVVMLCGCEEGGVELCAQYWPSTAGNNIMMKYGEFMVSTVSITDTNNGFIQRAITITDPKVRNCITLQ